MNWEFSEVVRRLANVVRVGTVHSVDYASARARIACGDVVTELLPWITARAGGDRTWWAPEIGEQVVVLAPDGLLEDGVILSGLYSDARPEPGNRETLHRTVYADGATIEYDRNSGRALVSGVQSVVVEAAGAVTVQAGSVTIDAPQTTCTGQLTVQGLLTYQGGLAGSSTGGGAAASISGSVVATGDVTAGGISVATHTHGGVQGGGSRTTGPG